MDLRRALRALGAIGFASAALPTPAMAGPAPTLEIEAPRELAADAERLRQLPASALDQTARLVGAAGGDPIVVSLVPEDAPLAREAPAWVAGYAYGALSRIVLFPERVPRYPNSTLEELLLHEVAHVLLDRAAGHRPLPRWFHEGLASVAGGPWDFRDGGRLSLAMLRSRELSPRQIDRLFQSPGTVSRGYAVATALVRDLLRRHGEQVVAELLARRRQGEEFDTAFRHVTGLTPREAARGFWHRQVFWYRWLPVLTSSATLWIAVTLLALAAIRQRRRRDEEIRERWEAEERFTRERVIDALRSREPPS